MDFTIKEITVGELVGIVLMTHGVTSHRIDKDILHPREDVYYCYVAIDENGEVWGYVELPYIHTKTRLDNSGYWVNPRRELSDVDEAEELRSRERICLVDLSQSEKMTPFRGWNEIVYKITDIGEVT